MTKYHIYKYIFFELLMGGYTCYYLILKSLFNFNYYFLQIFLKIQNQLILMEIISFFTKIQNFKVLYLYEQY